MQDLEILNQLKENSNVSLVEDSTQSDISLTDEIISHLIKEKYNESLAYQICEVQPIKNPFGKIFASRRNPDTSDFEIISKDVQTGIYSVSTGFTQEVLQDVQSQFGNSSIELSKKVISGLSTQQENRSVINKLDAEADTQLALTITDSGSFESVIFQLSQRIAQSVIQMNRGDYKTLDSFCVLSKDFAASILGSFEFMSEGKERSLFVGKIGRTDFYINPFPNTASQFTDDEFTIDYEIEDTSIPDYCYVGLKSKIPGYSSLVFTPYMYDAQWETKPDYTDGSGNLVASDGSLQLFVRNRYGLETSPLHQPLESKSLIHKFELIKG